MTSPSPAPIPDVRTRLEEREKTEGAGALFDELRAKDPEAAARMDPRNPRRTIRALEVIELTGKPYSASLPRYRYVIPSVQIGLDLDRPDLDHRIDLRTKQMYDDGFIEEVERLRPHLGATAVRALGYQQIIDLLDGIWDVNDAFADIAQKTKRLARKQMGWFGRDPRIHWLQALNPKLVDNAMAIIAHAAPATTTRSTPEPTNTPSIIWAISRRRNQPKADAITRNQCAGP